MQKFKIVILAALGFFLVYLVYTRIFDRKDSIIPEKVTPTGRIGVDIGDTAPELSFANPQGEIISLSSLRGKVVLIDFWAGWCPPCRRENPNIVNAYMKFNDKEFINGTGFTVYGLSLDKTREQWISAIEADGLIWPYHVSDLQGWNSAGASLYQVRAIPANWLIDGEGIIIARNVKGEALHSTLNNLTLIQH